MRELKFRVWDKLHKVIMLTGLGQILLGNSEIGVMREDDTWIWNGEEAIFMQYTGLKDKNGKEIYEGDIIERRSKERNEIYFANGCFLVRASGYDE